MLWPEGTSERSLSIFDHGTSIPQSKCPRQLRSLHRPLCTSEVSQALGLCGYTCLCKDNSLVPNNLGSAAVVNAKSIGAAELVQPERPSKTFWERGRRLLFTRPIPFRVI